MKALSFLHRILRWAPDAQHDALDQTVRVALQDYLLSLPSEHECEPADAKVRKAQLLALRDHAAQSLLNFIGDSVVRSRTLLCVLIRPLTYYTRYSCWESSWIL